MNPHEARELFGAAYDDELPEPQRTAFHALLAQDPELQQEYEAFRALLAGAAQVFTPKRSPDLMPGIQRKLRQRRGRLRGDRLGQLAGPGRIQPLMLSFIVLVILVALWLLMTQPSLWS